MNIGILVEKNSVEKKIIEISPKTIIMVVAILLLMVFLSFIRDIILLTFVAIILAAALDSPVDWLERRGVPRGVSVLFLYVLFFGLLVLTAVAIIPPIIEQFRDLLQALPGVFDKMNAFINQQGLRSQFGEGALQNAQSVLSNIGNSILQTSGGGLFTTITGIFGSVFSFGLVLVMTYYLIVQENGIRVFVRSLVPVRHRPYVTALANRIQYKIGLWLRGQVTLAVVIFLIVYIGLTALGVPYALVLAFAAGLLEVVPYMGPILAAIPAIFLAFGVDPTHALLTVVFYILVQQAENHILVPKIMQKALGLNPVIIIIALLIGSKIAGIAGILLAVPVCTAIAEFLGDFFQGDTSTKEPAKKDSGVS